MQLPVRQLVPLRAQLGAARAHGAGLRHARAVPLAQLVRGAQLAPALLRPEQRRLLVDALLRVLHVPAHHPTISKL